MDDAKYAHECETAERFIQLLGGEIGRLDRPNGPHPDVLWRSANGTIGLELTRVVSNQQLVEREALRAEVLRKAASLLEPRGIAGVYVWVHWQNGRPSASDDLSSLASELTEITCENVPMQGRKIIIGGDVEPDRELTHAVFDRISIDRTVEFDRPMFETMYSDWLSHFSVDQLSEIVARKSGNERAADVEGDAQWLVIYGSFGPLSSLVEPLQETLEAVYPSSFDRIYLALLSEKRLWELRTERILPAEKQLR